MFVKRTGYHEAELKPSPARAGAVPTEVAPAEVGDCFGGYALSQGQANIP